MTVNELFVEFIQYKEKIGMKTSSVSTYIRMYESKIKTILGDIKISSLNDADISEFILKLLSTELSRRYIKSICVLLFSIINYAKFKYKSYINLKDIQSIKFKVDKTKIKIFSEFEQNKIEKYIISNISPITIAVLLSLYTGIRNGEICALKVKDFDLYKKCVHINVTLQRVKNTDNITNKKTKIIIDKPKTKNSIRVIPLPEFFIPILKKLFSTVNEQAYFLTLSQTKFIEPRTLENKFKKILNNCNIENKKFHVLRHTFANNMLENGVDIKTLSEILGHSNVTITMNEYIHPSFDNKVKQIALLNQKFIKNHDFFDK